MSQCLLFCETEKNMLSQRLRDAQEASDLARQEAAARHLHLVKLDAYLASLLHLHEAVDTPSNASVRWLFYKIRHDMLWSHSTEFILATGSGPCV